MDNQLQKVGMLLELSGLSKTNKQASELLSQLRRQAGVSKFAMMPTQWTNRSNSHYGTMTLDSLHGFFVQMWWGAQYKLELTTLVCPPSTDMKVLSRPLGAPLSLDKPAKNPSPEGSQQKVLWESIRTAWARHKGDFETSWNRIFERAYNATNYIRGNKRHPDSETRMQLELEQSTQVFDRYFKGNNLFQFVQGLNLSNPESVFEQASALITTNIANGNFSSKSVATKPTDFESPEGGEAYNFSEEDSAIPYAHKGLGGEEEVDEWEALLSDIKKNDPYFAEDLNDIVDEFLDASWLKPEAVLSTKISTLAQLEMLATLVDECLSADSKDRITTAFSQTNVRSGAYAVLYAYLVMAGFSFKSRSGETITIKLKGNPFLVNFRVFKDEVGPELARAANLADTLEALWVKVEKYIPKKLFRAEKTQFIEQVARIALGGTSARPDMPFPETPIKGSRWFYIACIKEFIRLRLILEISDKDVLQEFEPGMDGALCIKALRAITTAPTQVVEEARLEFIKTFQRKRR